MYTGRKPVIGGARAMAAAKAKLVQALEGTGMTINVFCASEKNAHMKLPGVWRRSRRYRKRIFCSLWVAEKR